MQLTAQTAKCQRSPTNAIDQKQSNKRKDKVDKGGQ